MRYTQTREQVYEFLQNNPGQSFNAYEIAKSLKMNPVTVYRVLEFLKEHKLVHYVPTISKWILCSQQKNNQDHNFLVCKKCNSVNEYISPHNCTNHLGFQCEEHITEIVGICNKCL